MPSPTVLHDDAELQILSQAGDADHLVITFNEMTMRADGRRFWSNEVLGKLGVPGVGFMAKRPHWFADAVMGQGLEVCQPSILRHAERMTYGFSMGGYAAIRHAATLKVRTVIACSPQWTLEPGRQEGRPQPFRAHYSPALHDGMELSSFPLGARLYLIHDPHEPHDAWHAARIAEAIPATVLIRMPFTGHATIRPLASTATTAALLAAARAHDDEGVLRAVREARRGWGSRPVTVAAHLLHRRFDRGVVLLRRTPIPAPSHYPAGVCLAYGRAALAVGQPGVAAEMGQRAMTLAAGHPGLSAQAEALLSQIACKVLA